MLAAWPLTACVIAIYTLVDGHGSRISGAPITYTAWIFLLTAFPMVTQAVLLKRGALRTALRREWWIGLVGGAGNIGAYGLVLWAMGRAPVATVAALRETSILFATLIAVFFLKERVSGGRLAGTAVILAGALTLRLT